MSHLGSVMLQNSEFVRDELPKLYLPDDLRARVIELCDLWKETYFDLGGDTSASLLQRWVRQTLDKAHEVVQALDAASQIDRRVGSAYILVAESAVSVLNAT